jgi:phosphoglycerate kinase
VGVMTYHTLDDINVKGKRVVVRADLNVPVDNGKVTDMTRITRFAPTVKTLLNKGAQAVIILSHFDRPKGRVVPEMSLQQIVPALEKALGQKIIFVATGWQDSKAQDAAKAAKQGDVLLMENTRFHPGEEKNDPAFAKQLATLGDIYVNDAFSAAHRAHASTEGIAHDLQSCIGPSMQAELEALSRILDEPEQPVLAIVGGAKVSSKLDLIGNLIRKVDRLAIGGAMANTFLAAQGHQIGKKSLVEPEMFDTARNILAKAKLEGCEVLLPVDVVAANEFAANATHGTFNLSNIPSTLMVLDIGPATILMVEKALADSRTLLWNGPFGAFELEPFDAGTTEIARTAADLVKAGKLTAVAGGGDTVAALGKAGVINDFTYVSTAGGAFLEWLEGKPLPGVEVLKKDNARRAS